MGRRGGPGVGRGQIVVGGLRTSLRRRGKRRSEIEGGGVGGVGGGGVGVGGVGVEGGGGRGVDPRTKLVLLVESRRELVGGEGGRVVVVVVVVVVVGGADGGGGVGGPGEPGGVLGVEGGKRSATRVGEMMMISERMDWRELHAIVGGRSGIERDPLSLVLAEGGGRGVRGVGPLGVLPGEGGGVGVDRVCGGGHGSGGGRIGGTGQLSSTRPAEGRSTLYSL